MCESPIQIKFEPQKTAETDEFQGANINLPYKGPTTGMDTSLKARQNMKYLLKGDELFETTSDICDRGNFLETNAILKLDLLNSGPFDTIGSKLEFQNLYFNFKNITFNLKVKFFFNPLSICNGDFDTVKIEMMNKSKTNGSLMFVIDPEKGVTFENYFVTNGPDETNINALFYDLDPLFKDYNSTFRVFFDSFVDIYEDVAILSNPIRDQFVKVLCEYRKTNPYVPPEEKVINSYVLYKDKIAQLKKLNIYSTIFMNKP